MIIRKCISGFVIICGLFLSSAFSQILSFESFESNDFLHLIAAENSKGSGFSIGLEPRFSDYSYVDADNEFHLTAIVGFSYERLSCGIRLPLQWSWNTSFAEFLSNPGVADNDGLDDLRMLARYNFYRSSRFLISMGMIYSLTNRSVYWGDEPEQRRELSFMIIQEVRADRIRALFNLMYTDFDTQEGVSDKLYSRNYFLDAGLGLQYIVTSRFSLLTEMILQNSLPKYLSNDPEVEVQRWYSFNGGLQYKITSKLILQTGVTVSFRNRIKISGSSEENTFDLAREFFRLFWVL